MGTQDNIPPQDYVGDQEKILKAKTDPIAKFIKAEEYQDKMPDGVVHPILETDKWKHQHQTVIFVETKEGPPQEYTNRSTRFVTSLNLHETMKADIMSVADGNVYKGLVYTGKKPGGITHESLRKLANKWGYNQIIIVGYCGNATI